MIRVFQMVVLSGVCLLVTGCKILPSTSLKTGEKNKPIWEQVKIGDIAPSADSEQSKPQFLKAISFDVHIFEIPAENINKLDDIWKILYVQPLRFRDYKAFRANSFFVRFGQSPKLNQLLDLLHAADGQKVLTVKLLPVDNQANDVIATRLDSPQDILYVSRDGLPDKASVGPGLLCLRIRAQRTSGSRDMCSIIAEPAFSVPINSPVQDLAERVQRHEFIFDALAFGLKMSLGDFVLLGPERYISDQSTLGGLFFSKPKGSLFFGETLLKPPELKPSVRIFILVYSGISD